MALYGGCAACRFFPLTAGAVQEENPGNREDEEPIASVEDACGELLETFTFDEVDDALEELFPEERLDFQETVSRMIKGDVDSVSGLFLIYLTELLIANVLLPMIHIYMIVRVLSDLSRENYLTKCEELIETGVSWSLKALLAVVAGFNVVQGMISPAIDSVKRSILARGAEAIPGAGDALGGMAAAVTNGT